MITLHSHQDDYVSNIRSAMTRVRSVLAQGATGIGKTVIASHIVKGADTKGSKTIFMVHRRELITQTSKTFDRFNISHGYIVAGKPIDPFANVHIASVDTLRNRLDTVKAPNLLIVDECHRTGATGYERVMEWAKRNSAFCLGLTATPWRLDGKGLDDYYDEMVLGPSVPWLMDNGYLSRYIAFAPTTPDMSGTHKRMGDYKAEEVEAIMDDKVIFGSAVENWIKHAKGKKTICFCPSIKISEKMATEFRANGISAEHLDGGDDRSLRQSVINGFADGKVEILTNVNLFCEGFDLSAMAGRDVPIEAVILYRPTMSLTLHLQQCGRALRPKPYPAVILDHAGNLMRLGFPDDEFEWSLESRSKKKKSAEAIIRSIQCPQCYAVYRPALKCPSCGYVKESEGRKIEVVDGELVQLSKNDIELIKKKRRQEVGMATTREELERIRKERGYHYGWVLHMMREKGIQG